MTQPQIPGHVLMYNVFCKTTIQHAFVKCDCLFLSSWKYMQLCGVWGMCSTEL